MKRIFLTLSMVAVLLMSSSAQSRVGGGRSFGSRGSRGFSSPSVYQGTPFRNYETSSRIQSGRQPLSAAQSQHQNYRSSSFLKSLGLGLAGGFLGSLLFRSFGSGLGGFHGGFGVLELLVLLALLYLIFRLLTSRSPTSSKSSSDGAATLMRQARPWGWSEQTGVGSLDSERGSSGAPQWEAISSLPLEGEPIHTEVATDLFFRVQGAWASRDFSLVAEILEEEVRNYLETEISKLKASKRVNRLENIAVRSVEVVEAWKERDREYSTVKFIANLLDFTIDEETQQIVEGSRSTPVKFEEYWTFARTPGSLRWKLSAIQQS